MGVYTAINDPSVYFQTALYNGNSAANTITNDGNANLQADWLWFKERSSTSSHHMFDTSRGVGGSGKALYPDTNDAEGNDAALTSVNTDGFTLASTNGFNQSGQTNVCWQWKCNGGTTASNSDGSITSTVQANTTAGISIVTYTGNTTSGATIGHGLGVAPKVVITKTRAISDNWLVYHEGIGATKYLSLNTTSAEAANAGAWNNTAPSSTVVTLGSFDNVNDNNTMVAYCFAEKQGYSRFGRYEGNGNANGQFIYTGFKPAFILIKRTSSTQAWAMFDNKRPGYNETNLSLTANESGAEETRGVDILSNGFKLTETNTATNASGPSTYVFLAFAESPFISSAGVPTTAR